ncbi:MAG TPA: DUF6734 family protein [Hanamia sp.]
MKIIQSCWSCNHRDFLKFKAGWIAPEYHLMSWALSCLQLKRYYGVVLYSDCVSAHMLIDELGLPYDKVECNLDYLNSYHPHLWALPKIYTYSKQEEPFLHIDGDVYIWEPFKELLLNSSLITQNMEVATKCYEEIFLDIERNLKYFPQAILKERVAGQKIYGYNAGIFGGSDIDFFRRYTYESFKFINKNIYYFSKIAVSDFNVFFEQYLFYCLAKQENKNVKVLFSEIIKDNQYKGFGDFIDTPYLKKYLHLIGTYKRSQQICNQLADRLREDYPEYYYRIISLFKKNKVPLLRDYYHYTSSNTEKKLIERHKQLKSNFSHDLLEKYDNAKEIDKLNKSSNFIIDAKVNDEHIYNYYEFNKPIEIFVQGKFMTLSKDYLYGRDLNVVQNYLYIFADKETTFEKKIIADNIVEVIERKLNTIKKPGTNKNYIRNEFDGYCPMECKVALIPECDQKGYSIACIDDLSLLILGLLKKPMTIKCLLGLIATSFDMKELKTCLPEFEQLIFGRIKQGLLNKLIKVVF